MIFIDHLIAVIVSAPFFTEQSSDCITYCRHGGPWSFGQVTMGPDLFRSISFLFFFIVLISCIVLAVFGVFVGVPYPLLL